MVDARLRGLWRLPYYEIDHAPQARPINQVRQALIFSRRRSREPASDTEQEMRLIDCSVMPLTLRRPAQAPLPVASMHQWMSDSGTYAPRHR